MAEHEHVSVPADLLAIKEDVGLLADYVYFEHWDGGLALLLSWVGDAPGDEPKDTTYDALIEAEEKVAALGYGIGESYTDHDTAYFYILPKSEAAIEAQEKG